MSYTYEVIAKGLVKGGGIEEYKVGERFTTEKKINSGQWKVRTRLVEDGEQKQEPEKELVNQVEPEQESSVDVDLPDEPVELNDDIEKAKSANKDELIVMAKDLGIKAPHLCKEDTLRDKVLDALG